MLTVTWGFEGSGKRTTLSPLSSWNSVIPSTEATGRTPAGSCWAEAGSASARREIRATARTAELLGTFMEAPS